MDLLCHSERCRGILRILKLDGILRRFAPQDVDKLRKLSTLDN